MHQPVIQSLLTPRVTAWLSTLNPPAFATTSKLARARKRVCKHLQTPADTRRILAEISYPCSWWALQKNQIRKMFRHDCPLSIGGSSDSWAILDGQIYLMLSWEPSLSFAATGWQCWWPACCSIVTIESPNAPGRKEKSKAARKTSSHLINNALLKLVTHRKPVTSNLSFNTCWYFK